MSDVVNVRCITGNRAGCIEVSTRGLGCLGTTALEWFILPCAAGSPLVGNGNRVVSDMKHTSTRHTYLHTSR